MLQFLLAVGNVRPSCSHHCIMDDAMFRPCFPAQLITPSALKPRPYPDAAVADLEGFVMFIVPANETNRIAR